MIGFSSLWISLLGLPMFANISSDRFEFQEQDDPQEILIEMRGVLRCRFQQDTERLQSARVYTDQGMLDLELNSLIEQGAMKMTDRTVVVRGSLVQRPDRRNRLAWIVQVTSLEAVGPPQPWPPIINKFERISVERSGGFAGLMEKQTLFADGKLETRSLKNDTVTDVSNLDQQVLRQLHDLVGRTGWRHIHLPRPASSEQGIADQMRIKVLIETQDRDFEFLLSSPGTDQIQPLGDLIQAVGGGDL